ncbi:MAG: 5,10-methylenetetrahydrofolate reductase [Actinomycetota bacterium]
MTGPDAPTDADGETAAEYRYRLALVAGLTYEIIPMPSATDAMEALPPGATVAITCSPTRGIRATVALTTLLRAAGHPVVPHLAARLVTGPEEVRQLAQWLRAEGIDRVFIVGGDGTEAVGPYPDAGSFMHALLGADPGLRAIGFAAYPDGHPTIPTPALDAALLAKQQLLADAGVAGYAVTQMCFDPETIDVWLQGRRRAGFGLGVHLGLAGVVDRSRLLTLGARFGVGQSLSFLRKNRSAVSTLLTTSSYAPDSLLVPLSPILEVAGITGVHCFTFNQVAATAAWQHGQLETS